MVEREELGKINYEAFLASADASVVNISWENQHDGYRQYWIDAAQAVAERVMVGLQTSEEISD